jgi:glycine cleavage system H protein
MSTRWDSIKEFGDGRQWFAKEEEALRLGITERAVEELGAIDHWEWPEPGQKFSDGDIWGEIIGRNGALILTAPAEFEVLEINEEVRDNLSLLEDDPTGDAWLIRVRSAEESW